MLDQKIQKEFLGILEEELVPAMGCTEPIALAYASARCRTLLGSEPERIVARCSGNMIKNVRCVTIPNSGGMVGIETACVLGAIGGRGSAEMEVLASVTDAHRERTKELVDARCCEVEFLDSEVPLHFIIEMYGKGHEALVEIKYSHINIVLMKKDDVTVYETEDVDVTNGSEADRSLLTLERIMQFASEVELGKVRRLYERQIRYNMDIAYEGMSGDYGLGIGRVIRECYADSVVTRMKAYAAAASEARMSGCDMPVIITSGSGNQGIASSVPVIIYARENNIKNEQMYRALVFSTLLTVYQKMFIGKLSAFCGAVSASCASAAAITYLCGGTLAQIKATIDNTLANIPGIICDGAKSSCAAKIATSLDAGMMAHYLAMKDCAYGAYTGIIKEDTGETISCVGYIGKVGMQQTDKEIIKLMLD